MFDNKIDRFVAKRSVAAGEPGVHQIYPLNTSKLKLTIRSTTTTMNANPRDKYNGGIKLACDNVTGQVGLSYLNGTVVVMAPFSYISDGYFGKNLQMPVREGQDVYFLPFEAVLNQQPAPLTTVCPSKLSDGSLIESTDMSTLASYTSPLPAFVTGRGFGLIYTSDASFVDHFGRAPVYENVPITYELDKKHVTQTEVLFLSMQSILLSPLMADMEEWDPVELVPLSSVKAYLPSLAGPAAAAAAIATNPTFPLGSLSYAAPKSVSKVTFTDANAVLHRTPSANHAALNAQQQLGQRAKGSHSGGDNSDSAGLTTGDSMSTGHKQHRLHTVPDTACSSPSHSDRSAASSPCSSLATSPVATMSDLELLRARVPGPSDIWAEKDQRRSVKGVSKAEATAQQARAMAIRDFLSTGWAALEGKGFLINWGWDQRGDQLKSFLLPGKNKFSHLKDCKLIENLECFHTGESLYTHVQANPCLLEPWPSVFARLSKQGWMRAEHHGNSTNGGQTMFYFFSGTSEYRESSAKAGSKKVVAPSSVEEARAQGIVPGQLLFTTRAAMMRYIARYPFLLQSPEEFCETLQRLNWRTDIDINDVQRWLWEPTAEDRNGTCPWHFRSSGGSTSSSARESRTDNWVNLAELIRRLWLVPERLFQYVTPPLPVSALRQAIHLSEEEALAADQDIFSPEVKSVARADRDKLCAAATDKLSEYIWLYNNRREGSVEVGMQLEDSIKKLLKNLSWTEDRCGWSKEWWGNETAWVAPWTQQIVEVGNEPLLGRDYFWTMQHLAEYVSELTQPEWQAQHSFLYSPLLQCVKAFTPCPAQARAALREHANNLVLKLVRNGRGNPFEEGPLKDMLLTTGWEVFGDDAHDVVVFVPHWRTKDVNKKNYRQHQPGVDYFDTLDGVQSHLEEHGNQAAHVINNEIATKQPRHDQPDEASNVIRAPTLCHFDSTPQKSRCAPSTTSSPSSLESESSTLVFRGRAYSVPDSVAEAIVSSCGDSDLPLLSASMSQYDAADLTSCFVKAHIENKSFQAIAGVSMTMKAGKAGVILSVRPGTDYVLEYDAVRAYMDGLSADSHTMKLKVDLHREEIQCSDVTDVSVSLPDTEAVKLHPGDTIKSGAGEGSLGLVVVSKADETAVVLAAHECPRTFQFYGLGNWFSMYREVLFSATERVYSESRNNRYPIDEVAVLYIDSNGVSVDLEDCNYITGVYQDSTGAGKPIYLDGQITSVHKRKVKCPMSVPCETGEVVYFKGRHNLSYGTVTSSGNTETCEKMRFYYLLCTMKCRCGDSGGLLFRLQDDKFQALGILSTIRPDVGEVDGIYNTRFYYISEINFNTFRLPCEKHDVYEGIKY